MIISIKIPKEQRKALLNRYSSIKSFLQRILSETAERLIADEQMNNVEEELKEYHNRRVVNDYDIHSRKHSQATKDRISKSLKEKYQDEPKHHIFEETKRLISVGNKGKVLSQETKNNISKANTGKIRTLEQRENISKGHKGLKYKHKVKVK